MPFADALLQAFATLRPCGRGAMGVMGVIHASRPSPRWEAKTCTGSAGEPELIHEVDGAPPADGRGTVLVIDDEASVRTPVSEILLELGYAAMEVADWASALRMLRFDVQIDLITNISLANGMNGQQVTEAARELRPGLKVLLITGYAENALIGNGQLAPEMQVMTKPFVIEALASRVWRMITGDA